MYDIIHCNKLYKTTGVIDNDCKTPDKDKNYDSAKIKTMTVKD